MNEPIEIIKYRGHKIKIFQDDNCSGPDFWENDDVFLVASHRQFTVGRKEFDTQRINTVYQTKNMYNGYHIFALNAYIHSGVALSLTRQGQFGDHWDSSHIGFVLVKHTKGWSWTREKALVIAGSLLIEWNQYLSGEVYGYDSEIDSCWGFYGDEGKADMIEEAKGEIDRHIEKKATVENQLMMQNFMQNKPLNLGL
jgi:hypothetical protein